MTAFPPDLFAGRRYAVLGLGRNGLPAARALRDMGADVVAWDDRCEAIAEAEGLDMHDLREGPFDFDALVLSPGIPHRLPAPHPVAARAVAAGVPILSDAELLYQAVRRAGSRARFIGVTGTNGKSTTTALIAHILTRAAVPVAAGGNLGPAALALPLLGDDGAYVLEMSSYMLERLTTLRFDVAVLLNISPDHLDRHGDMAGYIAAKRAIFDRQKDYDLAIIGIDDEYCSALAEEMIRSVRISGVRTTEVGVSEHWLSDEYQLVSVDLRQARALPGPHNAQNAAAAVAAARAVLDMNLFLLLDDTGRSLIEKSILDFPGLPHRQQHVGTLRGIDFINDSKATNADAAARALACYDRVTWIAGGVAKAGGIAPLAPLFPRVVHALLIGQAAPAFAATLAAHGVPHSVVGTLEAAVDAARAFDAPVLLSPACASFDQFRSFEDRGERFAALVAARARVEEAV